MSDLVICSLAYSTKLDELKEELVAENPLATRTAPQNCIALGLLNRA